jgi:outer membrane protein, heavy metal efflux system
MLRNISNIIKRSHLKIHTALSFILLLTGCSFVEPRLGFQDVSNDVKKLFGLEVYWSEGNEADKAIKKRVAQLLSEPLTDDSAVQIALLNNRGIQGVYQDLNIAQADLVEAGLLTNPILGAEIRFPKEGPNFELSLVEDFIKILQIPMRRKIASAQFEQAKIHVIGEVLGLSATTKLSFYEYQSAQQRLEIAKTALDSVDASATLAKRLHESGNINDLDLQQEQATYESLKLETSSLEQQVIEKREHLNMLLGVWQEPHSWKSGKRLPEAVFIIDDIESVETKAIINSTELAQTRKELLALATSLGLASDFALLNTGELGASGAKEGDGTWGFGPAFSIPLPFFNQGQPALLRANAKLRKKAEEYTDLAIRLRAEARKLAGQLKIAKQQAEYFKNTLLPLRSRLVKEYQKQYNAMLVDAFQLLAAKREQIEVAEKYVDSLEQYWITNIKLTSLINGKNLENN